MGWIKRNPRRIEGVGERHQPVGQQQSDGMVMKIAKRLQEAPNFRLPVSRAPSLREQFLDEAQAAREELLAEIQRSAETDVGQDRAG